MESSLHHKHLQAEEEESLPSIMTANLLLLLCFAGLLPISVPILRTVPHKYELLMTPKMWLDARSSCRMMYNDAATIVSDTDWLRLQKVTLSEGLTTNAWAGVYNDVYNWRWVLNNIPLAWSNWIPGQPDNIVGNQMCGIIAKDNQWDDVQCDLIRPFICYDAGFSGASRFIGFSNPLMTWPDARTYCQTYHTDLASCLNSADNDLLVAIKVVQGDSWIGLHRDMDMNPAPGRSKTLSVLTETTAWGP
ncbi:putative C-type lectin domain family 20 member A [Silurus meridionalis]|uniref:putative C-type lectin domain family 20 member A n=1 Tax=Silurus meridionalis TaxID=175797 RepID=UPI001EECB371|nr:putative C-type lectin domain family 20 member A [Silurus meridionalis]